jgi:hypothetical protein
MMSIQDVARDVGKCCTQKLDVSPVSSDLPRLARRFSLQKWTNDAYGKLEFCSDIKKDTLETVVYGLLTQLVQMLKPNTETVSLDVFLKEVNLEFVDSISQYLLKYYGEDAPLNRMLKACSQSVVISTLPHVRAALGQHNIQFKDCRGDWIIFFDTGQNEHLPRVKQRRKEQVYRLNNGAVDNLYKFQWEIEICFDGLKVNEITGVTVRLLGIEFDTLLLTPEEQEKDRNAITQSLSNCHIMIEN